MALTPKEYRAKMIKERGKTESTGINPNSPRARLEREKSQKTKRVSITPKERRAKDIASRGDNFFTRKAKTPAISERAKKIKQAQADVEKGLPRGKPASSQMEDYKPKTAVASKPKAVSKPTAQAKKPSIGGVKAGLSEFGKAFAAARKAGKKDFTFRDKQYAAVTRQEVSKAGASGLGDYLNKLKRSETKIAKAPGQVTKKKGGTITLTGEQKQTAKEKMKARRRAMKGMAKYQEGGVVGGAAISPEEMRRIREEMSGAAMNRKELRDLQKRMPRNFERDFDRPRAERLPMRPGMEFKPEKLPMRPGMKPEARRLKEMSGAAVSENEMKSIMEQIGKPESRDRFAKGGSVMARGCKLGRKKPTKMY